MPGPRKKKLRLPQGEVEGTVMNFQTVVESFNEYLVDDGTVLNMKLVVTEVLKLDDAYDEQGQPIYLINSQNVTAISVPNELLRQPPSGQSDSSGDQGENS